MQLMSLHLLYNQTYWEIVGNTGVNMNESWVQSFGSRVEDWVYLLTNQIGVSHFYHDYVKTMNGTASFVDHLDTTNWLWRSGKIGCFNCAWRLKALKESSWSLKMYYCIAKWIVFVMAFRSERWRSWHKQVICANISQMRCMNSESWLQY